MKTKTKKKTAKKTKKKATKKVAKKVAKKVVKKAASKKKLAKKVKVKPIPEGAQTITAYLIVKNASAAIDFYKKAFGAKEKYRIEAPKGTVGHAELKIGDSNIMLAEEFPNMQAKGPKAYGGSPVTLHLYCKDVDAQGAKALAAGCKALHPVENQFYGERAGKFEDPFGHIWFLSSRIEKVSLKEMQKRALAMMAK